MRPSPVHRLRWHRSDLHTELLLVIESDLASLGFLRQPPGPARWGASSDGGVLLLLWELFLFLINIVFGEHTFS